MHKSAELLRKCRGISKEKPPSITLPGGKGISEKRTTDISR